jgi:hypothetical protein
MLQFKTNFEGLPSFGGVKSGKLLGNFEPKIAPNTLKKARDQTSRFPLFLSNAP